MYLPSADPLNGCSQQRVACRFARSIVCERNLVAICMAGGRDGDDRSDTVRPGTRRCGEKFVGDESTVSVSAGRRRASAERVLGGMRRVGRKEGVREDLRP